MLREATSAFLRAGKTKVLLATAGLVAIFAFADWAVGNTVSLGVLYILPTMLGALVLRPGETAGLAIFCALLRARFDVPSSRTEMGLRFVFASLAYFTSGLFVTALARNRELAVENLAKVQREQTLRREAEEQLRVLVESSPAAILTTDHRGMILAANNAADELFSIPEGQGIQGRIITKFLPLLDDALHLDAGFRTSVQCYGRRENGEVFLADTWFSTYSGPEGPRLAAIVVDSSDEMRDREEQNLRQLLRYNRIAAGAVSHEVRNLCGAISLLCANVADKHNLTQDEDLRGLARLVKGLEHSAALDLHSRSQDAVEEVSLRAVLDSLRIVIEPGWRDSGGVVRWRVPESLPRVVADAQGLLQAFLNLSQNSYRAMREVSVRELTISVTAEDQKVAVRFEDSGPGVAAPERLFQPFQEGAEGTGLGLYISRAVVRSYGGELRFEPRERGSCFVVELQTA
ncbi:MAG TPA: ATP-binding protein [Bryobacteraceae bacterium]|jgi:signal transduction histidine kinase